MPTIYVKLQQNTQQGYNLADGNYGGYSSGNIGQATTTYQMFRYTNVPVPKNSTITSATLHTIHSVKNLTGTAYSNTHTVRLDGAMALTPWLDSSRNEYTSRTWVSYGGSSTWNWNQSGPTRQMHSHDVQAHLAAATSHASWTEAGGSLTMMIVHTAVSSPGSTFIHTGNDGYSPVLEINYTPPASDGKQTVVNQQENFNFVRNVNNASAFNIEPHGFNQWFGAYVQPNYSVQSSFTTNPTAPPGGGNALRVEPTTGRPMIHFGIPVLEDGEWYNYSAYVFMPNTTPANEELHLVILGEQQSSTGDRTTTKGQWVRINTSFIAGGWAGMWGAIQGSGSGFTWDSAAAFYVANVQLTKGRRVRPYIAGSLTLTGATYGWAGVNTNGFVRATPPTVTVNTQYDKARRKYYAVNWTYAQADSHAQANVDVQVRKVK